MIAQQEQTSESTKWSYKQTLYWTQFSGQPFIPFKIHVYSVEKNDYELLRNTLCPYLLEQNITHKFVNDNMFDSHSRHHLQRGKAIVIYPPSEQVFRDLFELIERSPAISAVDNAFIAGDRAIGNKGRVHYRYELKDKVPKGTTIDVTRYGDYQFYMHNYDANRGEDKYLPATMTAEDDPFNDLE